MTKLRLLPPKHRIEKRAILLWVIQALLVGAVLLAASIASYVFWENIRWLSILAIIGASILVFVGVVVEPLLRYKIHRWEVTEDAVYGLSGCQRGRSS